jgi:hypothetical protein
MNDFQQFGNLTWPEDIEHKTPFTRIELQEVINNKRKLNQQPLIDLSGKININYNSFAFRKDEINIHTTDYFFDYQPDFDWINIGDEIDHWRRTCRLKVEYQRFIDLGIDQIRSDGTIQRLHVCEGLTFFEDSFKNLVPDGRLILRYFDLSKAMDIVTKEKSSIKRLEVLEKKIFTESDPTGLYYNKTIWTFDRISWYLRKVNFKTIQLDIENCDEFHTALIAMKN